MFNNELMADVHFVVGPPGGTQRVPGHKVRAEKSFTVHFKATKPANQKRVLCTLACRV